MSLRQRIEQLEDATKQDAKAPCFWCQCEDRTKGECTHKMFSKIPHEQALQELE